MTDFIDTYGFSFNRNCLWQITKIFELSQPKKENTQVAMTMITIEWTADVCLSDFHLCYNLIFFLESGEMFYYQKQLQNMEEI